MNKREIFRKSVVWALITTLINPAMIAPAFARDSDIYLNTTTGTTTAEPNVLFVLGTNDRMNVAEAWREYDPNTYDSHTEYLWNDLTIINGGLFAVRNEKDPVTGAPSSSISTAAPPVNPVSVWGTWAGALGANRTALWRSVKAYSQGVEGSDPGPRFTYRNYWNGSWLYWLPAGANTATDPRLWSTSFNRFQGHIQTVAGVRGGVTFPALNPPYDVASGSAVDYRGFNLCGGSISQIMPSTVLAPSSTAPNAGFYLNQQWVRYEPYLNLTAVNSPGVNYPGNHTTANGATANTSTAPTVSTFYRGYVDGVSGSPTNPPTVYRDNWPVTDPVPAEANVGKQGQPIRIQGSGNAGWSDLKADLGGFTFQAHVANSGSYYYPEAVLTSLRTVAYAGAPNTYSLPSFGGSSSLLQEQFAAWRGNRDNSPQPTFGNVVGTSAYYDTTVACDPSAGPAVANQCIQFGGSFGTITQACTGAGTVLQERDASTAVRFTGGTCVANGAPTCTINGVVQPLASCTAAGIAIPACTLRTDPQDIFYTKFYDTNCGFTGQSTVTVATCQWSGRQSVFVEGQGTYFYGGSCLESGADTSCIAGGTSLSLNGVTQSNVVGPYPSPPPTTGLTTLGCGNGVAAGNYNFGGSCGGGTEYRMPGSPNAISSTPSSPGARALVGPPAECTGPAGGTSLSIRGAPAQTYNQTCTNTFGTPGSGTCSVWYGTTCLVSNAPSTYCPTAQSSGTTVPGSFYQAYKQQENQANLYHECLADGPTLNPGAGGSYPTSIARTFATPPNLTASANTAADLSAAYTTNVVEGVAANAARRIDIYSVNYLNWKYGAKACRNSAGALIAPLADVINAPPARGSCSPIGRKTRLQVAKDALSGIVAGTDGVRLGLMVYNKTDAVTSSEGGNVAYAIRRMGSNAMGSTADDLLAYNNRADLIKAIQGVVASSRTPLTETMYEAYRYFSGRTPRWGTSTTLALSGGTVSAGREVTVGANADSPSASGNVFLLNPSGAYNSPMLNNPTVAEPANCQKNYVVMITNGQPEDDFSANADIKTMAWVTPSLSTVSPRTDQDTNGARPSNAGPPDFQQIPTVSGGSPYGDKDLASTANDGGFVWLDELTYFIATADVSPGAPNMPGDPANGDLISGRQSIVTYTIGFAGISAPVVQNAAVAAQGIYYIADNAQQLQSALVSAFIAIRNFNPTAAAATVPISSLNRGESSTDVYLAFFGPGPPSTWPGTVKKYQLSTNPSDCGAGTPLCLTGQSIIASTGLKNIQTTDPVTGQNIVDPTAASGPNSDGTAWNPASVQDGAKPNKGGTGYVLINTSGYTPHTRQLYTFLSGGVSIDPKLDAGGNKMHFSNSAAITKARLGDAAMNDATQEELINYIRGGDLGRVECRDGVASTCDFWGSWPHFATEHSKPAVVTYDVSISPPVQYLYYVQNNGMLTAVDANTGKEKWSFLIEEALPQLSTMRAGNNGPEIYVADGNPEVFFDDRGPSGTAADGKIVAGDGDRVWLYFGLRRGGRVMYAIDITDRDHPQFKWKISAEGGAGKVCIGTATCTSRPEFDELGQTWSTPLVSRINKFPNVGDPPALIFGGGYDPAEDSVPPGTRTMGRALYILNGDTADLIKAWGTGAAKTGIWNPLSGGSTTMSYAIPSDVTAISTDFDQFIDRVYVGDMGGNVWRFDITLADETKWQAEQLASLSNGSGEKRKFFFPPAVAPQSQPFAFSYDAVYIGSGDKEHPGLASNTTPATTDDRMFMLMDDPSAMSGGGTPNTTGKSALATPITLSTLLDIADTATVGAAGIGVNPVALIGLQGWSRRLSNGEKVVNSPTVFFNRLRFGTFAPLTSLNACTPPGEGRLNEIDSLSGSLFQLNTGSAMGASQRWYGGFLSRGYMSSTQLLVLPTGASGKTKVVYTFTCADANCSGQNILTLGAPTKVYWYMEPEQ